MTMNEWAKNEIAIAYKKENPNREDGEFDYGCSCYESALKAFESLCEDGHSGFSIKMTQQILNRLIDGKPLTPIEDTDDIWIDTTEYGFSNKDMKTYQCKRMTSLFKYVQEDGSVEYRDINRVVCVDVNNGSTYSFNLVTRIIGELFPLTMPYMPSDKSIKVYCEDFLSDKTADGDFDTVGILYAVKDDIKIEINRFFKECEEGFISITKEEYEERKLLKNN